VIGRGGLGEVFAADDLILGRRVALKFLKAEADAHAQVLEEARAAARLDHPYVCNVFETGEFQGRPFIAMEFLEGQTLADYLKAGRLPLQKAVVLAAEIAEALSAAHAKEIAHCDLKPANIMITSSGHVKLMDFGLAYIVRSALLASQDETNTMFAGTNPPGTPAYMAPEQIRGDMPNLRSDVFAFGIVFSEMLMGIHPFRARTVAATVAATVHDDAPEIANYVPHPSEDISQEPGRSLSFRLRTSVGLSPVTGGRRRRSRRGRCRAPGPRYFALPRSERPEGPGIFLRRACGGTDSRARARRGNAGRIA
jgi:serine/threonine protein kinase